MRNPTICPAPLLPRAEVWSAPGASMVVKENEPAARAGTVVPVGPKASSITIRAVQNGRILSSPSRDRLTRQKAKTSVFGVGAVSIVVLSFRALEDLTFCMDTFVLLERCLELLNKTQMNIGTGRRSCKIVQ